MAAARCVVGMPHDKSKWPYSELIHESPFEYQREAVSEFGASRTLPPCATETPTGMGPMVSPDTASAFTAYQSFKNSATTYGVSNSSFLISVVGDLDAFEYSGNTFLGWMNMPTYDPYSCQQACNALNATGTKCNTYNTCKFLKFPSTLTRPASGVEPQYSLGEWDLDSYLQNPGTGRC